MSSETPDFSEDERILASLSDPLDVEAFTNLMAHAHELGMSAADFVREEPQRTSRRTIKKLCLKNWRRSLRAQVKSAMKTLFEGKSSDPAEAYWQSLRGTTPGPPSGQNGQHRRT